jgi:NADH-quinone oxidoreductase subunit L
MSTTLPWIVLFAPLVSALLILLVTGSQRRLSAYISILAVAIAFAGSLMLFGQPDGDVQFRWIDAGPRLFIPFGAALDNLSRTMLLIVTFVGLLVHIYSLGYMKEDRDMARYFGGLSLFMFSMLGIVLADNFVMIFIFWELVGVSSFLLIGHWYERPQAVDAANKAFLCNRIGDFGFMTGILMLWSVTGEIQFSKLHDILSSYQQHEAGMTHYISYLRIAGLLIFCGPMGKSAQVPIHVWLPDAMEGPTPVSALIHAATMVAAGVYLLVRIGFLLALVPFTRDVIAWVGIVTAVLAALMATQQDDIKRILAYSTLSQLGYMVSAAGMNAGQAAMFHLFTHAFFKALLFLGAGAIIHSLHHEQNIWHMGGLRRRMPITFWTFAIGTLALMGCWPFSGFFSKDQILGVMAQHHPVICLLGLFTAFLTAFYMTRLFVVVFLNPAATERASHAHEAPAVMSWPLVILAIPAFFAGWGIFARQFHVGLVDEAVQHQAGSAFLLSVVPVLAIGAFLVGAITGFLLYRNRTQDPLDLAALRQKLYFDEFYAMLVQTIQGTLARASAWVDRWVIDGAGVKGLSGATWGTGFVLRFLQVGNLQAYAFFFGLGVILLVYLAAAL